MRKLWSAGALVGALLLAGCGDPGSGSGAPPPRAPDAPVADTPMAAPTPRPEASRPAPSAAKRQRHARKAGTRAPKVLYLGDSLAMENQDDLGDRLKSRLGARYRSAPYSGTTLCDYLEGAGEDSLVPEKHKAAALVRAERPDFVVLQFWGNAWGYTPCMDGITYDERRTEYLARYRADAARLAAQIEGAAGSGRTRVVWVLQGPDPMTPDRVRHVNGVYEARARASDDLTADAGRAVAPASARYTWAEKLPCTPYEKRNPEFCTDRGQGRTALHRGDDPLHFCLAPTTAKSRPCPVRSPGIRRITMAVADALAKAS